MKLISRCTYALITICLALFPSTALAATSDQRMNIEQAPMYDKFAETVLCASTGSSAAGTAIFSGSTNQQIAFNYLKSQGFSPQQSAGIVGNLIAESGVNPKRVQSTESPSGDRDTITIDGLTGYGIAQWTYKDRQEGLLKLSRDRGMSIQGDLPLQLDYLMQEFNSSSYIAFQREVKAATSLAAASSIFMIKFENPANQTIAAQNERASLGQKVLDLYGDSASSPPSTPAVPGEATPAPVQSNPDTTAPVTSCVEEGASNPGGTSPSQSSFVGFPLQTTKARMTALNGGQFKNGVMDVSGHPYAAHDIMADTGTPVMALLPGKVVGVSSDKCGGRLLSIYDESQGVTIAYLHLTPSDSPAAQGAALGATIASGQTIGFVGSGANGCGSAHLHIDANTTNRRIGCKRESCSAENKALFKAGSNKIGLAKGLYDSYMKLP